MEKRVKLFYLVFDSQYTDGGQKYLSLSDLAV